MTIKRMKKILFKVKPVFDFFNANNGTITLMLTIIGVIVAAKSCKISQNVENDNRQLDSLHFLISKESNILETQQEQLESQQIELTEIKTQTPILINEYNEMRFIDSATISLIANFKDQSNYIRLSDTPNIQITKVYSERISEGNDTLLHEVYYKNFGHRTAIGITGKIYFYKWENGKMIFMQAVNSNNIILNKKSYLNLAGGGESDLALYTRFYTEYADFYEVVKFEYSDGLTKRHFIQTFYFRNFMHRTFLSISEKERQMLINEIKILNRVNESF
jgi:hypothetical protein